MSNDLKCLILSLNVGRLLSKQASKFNVESMIKKLV